MGLWMCVLCAVCVFVYEMCGKCMVVEIEALPLYLFFVHSGYMEVSNQWIHTALD